MADQEKKWRNHYCSWRFLLRCEYASILGNMSKNKAGLEEWMLG